ncbi:glycerate kinase [Acaryochloris sp. IP29b_bin.148]|uniref:glycerate kinase n=1 Tax=Acaryochloris sp. IP29b_bin.148 TaxID=2969218 RepID=UPI002625286F|nr:glycerate kinase [Acaryochloris sp. IP29b_bin.148]
MDSLEQLIQGQALKEPQKAELGQWMLSEPHRAAAFGLTPASVETTLHQFAQLLPRIYSPVEGFWCGDCQISTSPLPPLWRVWMPLACQIAEARQNLNRPLIQGILGMQGAGKTTLTTVLQIVLEQLGYSCCCLSIDDLYKTYGERQQLQVEDPRLKWRGPPGTHDVDLGIQILDQMRANETSTPIQIPRFDKSAFGGQGDRSGFESVPTTDIVLFEGWFVGVKPISTDVFEQAPAPIDTPADRKFAMEMNQRLQDYLPLWDRLDRLMVLNLADYQLSKQWRKEAEHKAIATGNAGMSDGEIDEFVDYFWKALHPELFVKPLTTQENGADLVITVNADHTFGEIYQPACRSEMV